MRAALIRELGQAPEPGEIEEPAGETLEVLAAAVNPVDRAIGSGRFYGGHPELPYVPGTECVARDGDRLVYVFGGGLGGRRNGTFAERVSPGEATRVELPAGSDPALAVALGIPGVAAWIPVTRTAAVGREDRVLVLAATGTLGQIAVQAAKLRGAARVVAAGRDRARLERTRELGADETVELDGGDLAARFREACGGDGATVVIDPLWGEPLAAALEACAPGARVVNIGASAGAEVMLPSASIRGKQLHLVGHTNFAREPDELRDAYLELVEAANAGRVRIELERFPLDGVADAWGSTTKAVVEPQR